MFWLGLGTSIAVWPWWHEFVDPPKMALLSVGLPLWGLFSGRAKISWEILLLLAGACATALFAPIAWDAFWGIWTLLLLWMASRLGLLATEEAFRGVCWGLCASTVLCVAEVLGFPLFNPIAGPAGFMGNKNLLCEAAVLGMIWTAWQRRWWLVAGIAPIFPLTYYRGGLIALAVGLLTPLCKLWQLALGGLAVAGAYALWGSSNPTPRLTLWLAVLEHPTILGHGIGQFFSQFPKYLFDPIATRSDHAHNEFLEVLFELGVVGLAWFGCIWAKAAWKSSGLSQALLAALAVECCFEFPLHEPTTLLLGGGVLGCAISGWPISSRCPWSRAGIVQGWGAGKRYWQAAARGIGLGRKPGIAERRA